MNKNKGNSINDSAGKVESVTGFTAGKEIDINDPKCYAKRVTIESEAGTKEKFYVKYDEKGFMYDPWGLYSEGTEERKLYGDELACSFKKVVQKSFFYYLDYLRTRNKAWLRNAEREATSG